METLSRVTTTVRNLWQQWNLSQRVTILGAIILSVVTVIGVGFWSTRPDMVQLASRLSPEDAAEMVAQLDAAGIDYELSYSGSTISVAKTSLNRARLAAREILGAAHDAMEMEDSIWADPNVQGLRIQRQLEQRLAASIARFQAVKEAVVHISMAQPTPFVRDQSPTTASVVIDLVPGMVFSQQDAEAVVSLVSHGVEGLKPTDVTLMDTSGRLLNSSQGLAADVGGQLEYVRTLESHLAAKAETLLSQMLGTGRALVRVTADVDFTQSERMETTYDPENKVKLSETIKSESTTGPSRSSGGPAGTPSNVGRASSLGDGSVTSRIEENTTEFANTEIRDTVKETPGRIKRLTVAAIVDLTPPEGATGPTITTSDVESLIKQAVGFDSQRSDEINVVSSPLAGIPESGPAVIPIWQQYAPLVQQLSFGLGATLMFVLGLLILRRLRPLQLSSADEAATNESVRRLAELTIRARENPDLVATVLEHWLDEEGDMETSSEVPARPRRSAA
ncbi:MAG: flagellar M-ring protein FliF [Planctomycetaceae bacterium]|nr:flagellar M-ring protein FliF [Planctomycetaceae bacterium]